MSSVRRFVTLANFVLAVITGVASAEVERIEITSRSVFAGGETFGEVGAYEKIRGRLFYAVDPENAANQPIVDLELAARYPARESYVSAVRESARRLVADRILLAADGEAYAKLAGRIAWPPEPVDSYPFWKLEPQP